MHPIPLKLSNILRELQIFNRTNFLAKESGVILAFELSNCVLFTEDLCRHSKLESFYQITHVK